MGVAVGQGKCIGSSTCLCTPLCAQYWLAGTESMLSVLAASRWIGEWEASVKEEGKA